MAHNVTEALALVGETDFAVIGGAEAFALMADHATLWEITQVHEDAQGEVFMALPGADWVEVAREEHAAAGSDPAYTFVTYRRAEEGAQPCA